MIYLDNNATTRPRPEVIAAMSEAMAEFWANPSSKHAWGQEARRAINAARSEVAEFLGAQAVEVVFTSGATEANQHALLGALRRPGAPQRVILSAVEHAGFMKAALNWQQAGVEVVLLPVDAQGQVRIDVLHELAAPGAALISVMAANNETGVLQPVAEIARIGRALAVPVHVDATQIAGKLPVDFSGWDVDLLSVSAHKLHGPKGVGALVIRKGLAWPALIVGQQERTRRGGTENSVGIIGFAAAARQARAHLESEARRLTALREKLEHDLLHEVAGLSLYGTQAPRLPNTVCLSIAGLSADKILDHLQKNDICASSGAACTSGGTQASHVLLAMGVAERAALSAIRLSLGWDTLPDDISAVVHAFSTLTRHAHPPAAKVAELPVA